MAVFETWIESDLQKMIVPRALPGNAFCMDSGANLIGVSVMDGGEPATLSGTVAGKVVRSDGTTVPVTGGTLSGNRASIILPQRAYEVPGPIAIAVTLTSGSTVTTIGAVTGYVVRSQTDSIIDPGTILPTIDTLINQIQTAIDSIPADYSQVIHSIAPSFSFSTAYSAGDIVWYPGEATNPGALYQFTSAHAAGEWTGTDATAAVFANELSSLKSALNMIETPQIVGMTDTGISTVSSNLFQYATMIGYHKVIYSISVGKVVLSDATSSNTYLIPVDGVSTYTFTFLRSAVVVSDTALSAVGSLLNDVTSVNSTGGKYIVFSFNTSVYPESTYSITKHVNIYKLPANWDLSDITISTPQIDGMLPTGKTVASYNLFSKASLVASGKYVDHITNGKAVLADNANLDTYIISVDGESIYTFTNCRTAVVVSDLGYTAVGNLLTYATEIDSTGGTYILFSFNRTTYPTTSYQITKPVPQYAIPADWTFDDGAKQRYQIKSGSIASGGALSLSGKTAVKYGQRIVFKGFITTFSEITLAFYNYNNSAISNSIVVDGTSMIVYVGSSAVDPFTHGLTIANDISLIVDYLDTGVEITLESNGEKYKAVTAWERLTSGVVSASVKSSGTVCTSAMLVMAIERAEKPIWYFGDSYISYTNPARWPYYLIQYKFDGNTLLNGYAGGTSAADMMAFEALLNYGTPKFAVFATGMNDNASTGGDTASEAAPAWVSARDNFLAICDANEITPIFCTVPTVPSVNNQKKNEWIRSSGYRYIDYAKAVGANADGEWYGNGTEKDMLSSDRVHPTVRGAIALFTQAITDFPEFLT